MKKNWEIKTLGEVCEVIAGGDVPKNDYSKIKTKEHRIPIFTNGEKNKGLYGFTSMPRINKSSITISARGTIGYIELRDEPFYPAIRLISATPKDDNINILFLRHAIGRLIINSSGTSIPQLTVPMMKNYEIPIPSIKEQKEIVEKLDKGFELIDSLKETAKKNLDNAKELFQSVLREELSPKEGWETKTLGEVTKIIGGGTPQKNREKYYSGDILWATVRDMKNEVLSDTEFKITSEGLKNSSSNIIPKNNIIIATRVGLGKVCKLLNDTAINQDLKGVLPISKYTNSNYLYYYFLSQSDYIIKNGKGATVHGVTLNFINSMIISFPKSIKEQEEIVGRLDRIKGYCEELEGNYKRVLVLCEELKQGLLREAFEVK